MVQNANINLRADQSTRERDAHFGSDFNISHACGGWLHAGISSNDREEALRFRSFLIVAAR
jgi:hypothetical protein